MLSALSFTSPFILAALAALPAIWLLLRATPPAPKRTRFPAFIILRKLATTEETPDRTPWWLMLLRLLLAAIVIIGLAGPILNAPAPSTNTGPLVLVVDNSWGAAANWPLRRDAMAAAAEEAVQSERSVLLVTTAPQRIPSVINPMTGEEARDVLNALAPTPFAADRSGAISRLNALDAALPDNATPEIRWLTDGLSSEGDVEFARTLAERGDLSAVIDRRAPKLILRAMGQQDGGPAYRIERLYADDEWEGELAATARDGRELVRRDVLLAPSEASADVTLDLPLALRNELATVRFENISSAAAVQLIDARDRRALIGVVGEGAGSQNTLLSGAHYIRKALGPYAEFLNGSLSEMLESDASVIILDDVGRLRLSDEAVLGEWIERGGVLIRFAGPALAEAAQDEDPALLPVALRGGGRAFGGALTWDTPQTLDDFPADSPFAGLAAPQDVLIRQQVLASPGGETTERTWARLSDGTPLVTGEQQGAGTLALFHVTATPGWSDLPLSGVFVEMLRRLTFLSELGPESAEEEVEARYAPLRLLNGFGRFMRPGDEANALTAEQLSLEPGPERAPGLYGPPEAPLALNVINSETPFEPLSLPGVATTTYQVEPPVRVAPYLFAAALFLLLADGLITLLMSGRLRMRAATAGFAAVALVTGASDQSIAQPLDAEIDQLSIQAALLTRLAFVETGDPATDRISSQGLTALSRELIRRTSIEPGTPVGVNPETDDLSVYPFLYWPIVPGAEPPSEEALANIENFMRFGGLIMFDTRDDERAIAGASTPERNALRDMLSQMDIPPLTPVDNAHVLTRSFYLLSDLQGRTRNNPVWVQAGESGGANDGVTPLIIGGRDWAGAWAADNFGSPVKPMGRGGERARELAYRAGVNVIMVAYTGNYKSDQVHTPILLERLGE